MAKPHDRYFKIFRIYYFINASLLYSIVFFHRNCPSVVSEDMAKDFIIDFVKNLLLIRMCSRCRCCR